MEDGSPIGYFSRGEMMIGSSFSRSSLDLVPSETNEFWKDVPDHILDALYKQLEESPSGSWTALPPGSGEPRDFHHAPSAAGGTTSIGVSPSMLDGTAPSAGDAKGPVGEEFYAEEEEEDDGLFLKALPPSPELIRAYLVIEHIEALFQAQNIQLDQMRQVQRQVITGEHNEHLIAQLQNQQWNMLNQIQTELKELQSIHMELILEDPAKLHTLRMLLQQFQIQQRKIRLLQSELNHFLNPVATSGTPCFVALVLKDQPTPFVLFKGKQIDDSYQVSLITGSCVNVKSFSQVKASLKSAFEMTSSWKSKSPLENHVNAMDVIQRIAHFRNIKVNVSTRMNVVTLKFGIQVQLTGPEACTHMVETAPSSPLIVITNESQWSDAAFKLLMYEAFSGMSRISWYHLANVCHTHFLKASRQEPASPTRRLNRGEFQYLHHKFFGGASSVTREQAQAFWAWFGQVVQTLRFKRHIAKLWYYGLIYGFISKEVCNQLLMDEEPGCFLVRFSESYSGAFAVAYVDEDPFDKVKHYLVKPEDISSNKSLPDFLREKAQFRYISRLDPSTGKMRSFDKDAALESYYSKRELTTKPTNGYVLL